MAGKLTKTAIDSLEPGAMAWDATLPGFGVRARATAKTFVVKYRAGGRQRLYSIGRYGAPWTVEQARKEARRVLGRVAEGEDPAADKAEARRVTRLRDLAEAFMEDHGPRVKASTAKEYRRLLDRYILPKLGGLHAEKVARRDIARFHHGMRETPYQANRCLATLSKLFAWAEAHGYRADATNPTRHVKKYKEEGRERFLTAEEMARLGSVLREAEDEALGRKEPEPGRPLVGYSAVLAIRLLVFTGCRLGEILGLRWDDVDIERGALRLPDSKTGRKVVYLNAPAREALANAIREADNPYVIAGHKVGRPLVNLEKPWRELRQRAGLDDVRIHDLRHSFASVAAAQGASLPVIGALLGHKEMATTARYAHLADDPIKAANDAIGRRIASVMEGGAEGAEVVPLGRK